MSCLFPFLTLEQTDKKKSNSHREFFNIWIFSFEVTIDYCYYYIVLFNFICELYITTNLDK